LDVSDVSSSSPVERERLIFLDTDLYKKINVLKYNIYERYGFRQRMISET